MGLVGSYARAITIGRELAPPGSDVGGDAVASRDDRQSRWSRSWEQPNATPNYMPITFNDSSRDWSVSSDSSDPGQVHVRVKARSSYTTLCL